MPSKYMEDLHEFKGELNKVSPTFCAAKWKQVTVHLENGLTHSCHHPSPHKIPLSELRENVSALHNTKYKKSMRKLMLEGKVVDECGYCNRIECNNTTSLSDRIYKSNEPWAKEYISDITEKPWDDDVFPSYLEVSFSSVCNCVCIYCSPQASTGWEKEIRVHGRYGGLSESKKSFRETPPPEYGVGKDNPYLEAFWKWWPDLYKNVGWFRITGGEPLLSKETFKVLDYLIENPRPKLNIDVNSNFSISPNLFDRFIEKYKRVSEKQPVGVFTSCESVGKRAEYIRMGLNYDKWLDNCRKYLTEVPNGTLKIMATYNILSITSFQEFLVDILSLKQEFPMRVHIDIPFLVTPPYLQPNNISKDYMNYIEDTVTFMYKNMDVSDWPPIAGNCFWDHEISKLVRIFYMVEAKPENRGCLISRRDFVNFVDERDRRYNTNFLKVFPEYSDFYHLCKGID